MPAATATPAAAITARSCENAVNFRPGTAFTYPEVALDRHLLVGSRMGVPRCHDRPVSVCGVERVDDVGFDAPTWRNVEAVLAGPLPDRVQLLR